MFLLSRVGATLSRQFLRVADARHEPERSAFRAERDHSVPLLWRERAHMEAAIKYFLVRDVRPVSCSTG